MKRFEEIYETIKQDIQTGILSQGQALPSIRKLSQKHKCSNGTIVKAL
ncbi:MAG: GntR family transcriptional regulator, partial [Streptococcaceae bacterium]|nr:GntR family transcriptional regulator [Streptococcaceae bacterium]